MSTSLMGLQTSTPGVTNDLTAATNIETNWPLLDVHDHSSGKGAQVPTSGLNINANLTFGGYKAYNLLAAQFSNQSSSLTTATNKPCVYVLNGELRFIDNSGNDVLLTNSGSVAGTSGSISGLTAPVAAGFASNTFSWQANSGTGLYAKMSNADINLYEATAGITNAVTLKSPTSLAASYSILFPTAVPASTSYVTMANTGQLATASADSIGQAMTATGANAIAATRTRGNGIVAAAGEVGISLGSSTYSSTTTSALNVGAASLYHNFATTDVDTGTDQITITSHGYTAGQLVNFSTTTTLPSGLVAATDYYILVVDANTIKVADSWANYLTNTAVNITSQGTGTHTAVPILSVTITTSGRPVYIGLIPDGSANGASIFVQPSGSTSEVRFIGGIFRNGTRVGYFKSDYIASTSTTSWTLYTPPSAINMIDAVAAGTYTYKLMAWGATNNEVGVYYSKLIAYEI